MNYIFTNALIFTMDAPGASVYGSLLVTGEKIAMLGTLQDCQAQARSKAEIIDLGGRVLLPAFTDCHTHFTDYAKKRFSIDLAGCVTIDDIIARIEAFRATHPVLPDWILGCGWDKNSLDQPQLLTAGFLDMYFPETPVALFSKDYHSRWCNGAALRLAGINSASADPPDGKIWRGKDSAPTGIVSESASDLISRFITQPSSDQLKNAVQASLPMLHSHGLAALNSMENQTDADLLDAFVHAEKALRICRHFPLAELDSKIAEGQFSYTGDEWFKTGGVKIFADGSLGSQTAATFHDYPGSKGNRGILRHDEEELFALAAKAGKAGISCVVHAIGDRAVHTVVSALLRQRRENGREPLLQRIEHVQAIVPEDIPLLKKSGAYCSLQPVHLANDVPLIEKYWRPIRDHAYCFRSLREQNIPFGFGSDAPIESINPFLGIYSAAERKPSLDPHQPTWLPFQRLTLWDALYAYTLGAAAGSDSQHLTGSLTPGKLADLIVLENFTNLPPDYWLSARSLLTVVGGKIVYRDGI